MAARTISEFKSKLVGGGARANQFEVTLNFPTAASTGISADASFFVKAAALPGQAIDEIAVEFRGRTLYVAGDRTFEQWTTTVINDESFMVRNAMEQWMNLINNIRANVATPNMVNYTADLLVTQYGKTGAQLKQHKLLDCWPVSISAIELSWDTRSEIETFDVTWRYSDFQGTGGQAAIPGDGSTAVDDAVA